MPVRSGATYGGADRTVSVLKLCPAASGARRAGSGERADKGTGGDVGAVVAGAGTELAFFGEVSAVEGDAILEVALPFAGHGFGITE